MFEELEERVREWAFERNIPQHSTPKAQLLKAVSELGELCDAEIKDDRYGQIDGIGDVLVCLIIYCQMREYTMAGCLQSAYEEIKDRKGKMAQGGAFVKEL
jgi:NTP pyrophosphatase (non-canonical NTP hydrolase)